MRTLRQFGPTLLLLACMFNWWWSLTGSWELTVGSVHYSHGDSFTAWQGLYSIDGRLYFLNCAKLGMYSGIAMHPRPPVMVVATGPSFDFTHPRFDSFTRSEPYFLAVLKWDKAAAQSGYSRSGFVGVWEPESARWAPQRGVSVPWWFLVAVFAMSPLRSAIHIWTRRERPAHACCRCGYDLRATPERCPECGTRVAAAAGT